MAITIRSNLVRSMIPTAFPRSQTFGQKGAISRVGNTMLAAQQRRDYTTSSRNTYLKDTSHSNNKLSRLFTSHLRLQKNPSPATQELIEAVKAGHFGKVQEALTKGGDPNVMINACNSILHLAAANGKLEIVRELLQQGAHPDTRNADWGVTPLHTAAFQGHGPIVDLLIMKGADVQIKSRTSGRFPLDEGIGHIDCCHLLLKAGCQVNYVGGHGWTPLIEACSAGDEDLVHLLLNAKADPNLGNGKWKPVACALPFPKVLKLLLNNKALVDHTTIPIDPLNRAGNTLLHAAAAWGMYESVELLLQAGVKPGVKNKHGLTALELAQRQKLAHKTNPNNTAAMSKQILTSLDICITLLDTAMRASPAQ